MHSLKKLFFHSPAHYIAAVIISVAVMIFRFFTLPEDTGSQYAWYEVLSVSGYVTFLIGGLFAVAHLGAFDIFGYAFSPGRMGKVRKYRDYTDYQQQKQEKRAKEGGAFVPYFLVGIVLFLISLLFA